MENKFTAETLKILKDVEAVISNSHIIYTSGRHGESYINKDAIYPHTPLISRLCSFFAEQFKDSAPETVVAPALGGIILSQWTAHHLSQLLNKPVSSVYAEKTETGFGLLRGYDRLVKGRRVLILEDVVTTGGSLKKVIDEVKKLEANIVGVGALCNRGGVDAKTLGVDKIFSLISLNLNSWESQDCPMCKANVPINTQIGKGEK
jgi:orotate phosphoribosyltransferase